MDVLPCFLFIGSHGKVAREKGKAPIIVATIDRELIQQLRDEEIAPYRPERSSKPMDAICDLLMKNITPLNRLHDPYVVALLLAIASYSRDLKGSVYSKGSYWVWFLNHIYSLILHANALHQVSSVDDGFGGRMRSSLHRPCFICLS